MQKEAHELLVGSYFPRLTSDVEIRERLATHSLRLVSQHRLKDELLIVKNLEVIGIVQIKLINLKLLQLLRP